MDKWVCCIDIMTLGIHLSAMLSRDLHSKFSLKFHSSINLRNSTSLDSISTSGESSTLITHEGNCKGAVSRFFKEVLISGDKFQCCI